MLYGISQYFGKFITKYYFRIRVIGREHIPSHGSCLVVANHASFLDPFLICITFPRVIHYITYSFFYYHPASHWFCKRAYCIPVKKEGNDVSALKKSLRLLRQGEMVGIFPEGARSHSGKLTEAAPGTVLLALKAGVPILPIGVQGAYQALPRGSLFPKPRRVTLSIGAPFLLHELLSTEKKNNGEMQQEATSLIMGKIAALCGQYDSFFYNKFSHIAP